MTQTLLLIEDDARLAGMVAHYLRESGYAVVQAGDGATGLQALAESLPDLVILDLMLPDIDGLELCRRIKAQSAAAVQAVRQVPVVLLQV